MPTIQLADKPTLDAVYNKIQTKSGYFHPAIEEYNKPYFLPFLFNNTGCAVVYNNRIHILGGEYSPNSHYSWDGYSYEWKKESELPYSFVNGTAVVCNDKIHIISGYDNLLLHYSWNGNTWEAQTNIPERLYEVVAVSAYGSYIHILGTTNSGYLKHYKYDENDTWIFESTLNSDDDVEDPYYSVPHVAGAFFDNNTANIYYTLTSYWNIDECIYSYNIYSNIVNEAYNVSQIDTYSSTKLTDNMFKYNDNIYNLVNYGWINIDTKNETMNYSQFYIDTNKQHHHSFSKSVMVVFNSKVYMLGGVYAFIDGNKTFDSRKRLSIINLDGELPPCNPYETKTQVLKINNYSSYQKNMIVYKNNLYLFDEYFNHYVYDNFKWTQLTSKIEVNPSISVCYFIYNDSLYFTDGNKFYQLINNEWVKSDIKDNYSHCLITYKNQLHSFYNNCHDVYDGISWINKNDAPYNLNGCNILIYNDEIHVLGALNYNMKLYHYKWDGNNWASVSTLPDEPISAQATAVLNNELYLFGKSGKCYKWNGSTWEIVDNNTKFAYYVIGDSKCIQVFSSDYKIHCMYIGGSWRDFDKKEFTCETLLLNEGNTISCDINNTIVVGDVIYDNNIKKFKVNSLGYVKIHLFNDPNNYTIT